MDNKTFLKRQYLVRIARENGETSEFYMYAPDDNTAIENANVGFQREFQFSGLVDALGRTIMEEKIND